MSEQDPTPQTPPETTPYRPRPEDPHARAEAKPRRIPKGLLAAVIALAGGATLLPRFFHRAKPTLDDVPASLLRTPSTFPGTGVDLGPATPLAPLLAADSPDDLAMIEPSEGAHRITRGGSVYARFNRPMVRASDVGRPLAQSPLRFTPPIRGTARWVTRSSVQFEPDASTWNAPVETTLSLAEDLRSLAGETVAEPEPRTFVFAGGTQVELGSDSRRVLPGESLKLYFRGPVDLAAITSQMMIYEIGGGQRSVAFTLSQGATDERGRTLVNVALARALDPGSRVAIALQPAIYSTWEGNEAPGVVTFEFTPRPRFEGIACSEGATEAAGCEFQESPGRIIDVEETLRLWATNPLATPLPAGAVTVTPPVNAFRVAAHDHELAISAEWEPGQAYEIRLGAISDTLGHVLGAPGALAVRSQGRAPEVQTATGRLTFERAARIELPFAGIHIDRASAWYAPVAPGDELRAALLLPEVSHTAGSLSWTSAALQPLAPASRANHWGRGRYAWLDPAHDRRATMALVSFDANTADEATAPSPTFMQSTDVGINATSLAEGVLVWATSILTAEPLANAEVTLADRDARPLATARTDAHGVAWIPVAEGVFGARHAVRVTQGDDRAVLVLDPAQGVTPSNLGLSDNVAARPADAPVASVWTDRGAYRPGESMHAKAVVRTVRGDTAEAVRRGNVRVVLTGPDGDLSSKRVNLNAFGSVDADFEIPASAMLGDYSVAVWADPPARRVRRGAARVPAQAPVMIGSTTLRVGEFRQPTVRVDLELPSTPLAQGDALTASVRGAYLFGAPTANTTARWTLLRDGVATWPVRWDPFTFTSVDAVSRTGTAESGEITLDAEGEGTVSSHISLSASQREKATVEVVVRDASGQETSAWRSITVFPANYEVGLRKGPDWVERGASLDLDAVVIDHAGAPVAGRTIQARVLREGWHSYWEWRSEGTDDGEGEGESGAWQARRDRNRQVMHSCTLTSGADPVRCAWTPDRPGTYVLEAVTTDERGRRSVASRRLYVAGPGEHPDRDPPGAPIQVTPSRTNWFVGERFRIAFECPWAEADALVSVHREGIIHTERRRVQAGGVTMELPVTREMVPNAFVTVTLVRPRTGPALPTGEFDLQSPDLRWGATELSVRPQAAPLAVQLALGATQVRPDTDVAIDVDVRDGAGQPVASEVALYAVDEGTLRLTSYTTPDPTSGLLPRHAAQFSLEDLRRGLVSRVDFPALPGASGDGGEDSERGLRDERDVFDPTPLWLPHVTTDAQGHAHAVLHVPSRNTQYRVMAVAIDAGMRSGGASANVTASRPVVMRPAFPRALTAGDRFEAAAFLHNAERNAVDATVTPVVNGHRLASRTVHLEAAAELRVSEPLTAEGDAVDVAFEVTAGGASDRAAARIPVAPRVRWSRSGSIGAVRHDRTLTIDLPDEVDTQRGEVIVDLTTHPFVGLDGAMEDLLDTPWGGAEAHSSSVLGWASLARLGVGLRPARWSSREVRHRAETALETLVSYQGSGGGFGAWTATDETHPYVSAWSLHALVAAQRAGFALPEGALDRAVAYLTNATSYGAFNDGSSGWNDELAFALRVLAEARHPNGPRVTALYDARDSLTPFGLAQLAMAMDVTDTRRDTLLAAALRRVGIVASGTYRDTSGIRWYASSTRTVGAILEALASGAGDLRGARALSETLLDLRLGHDGASWGSSHETACALAGLAAYAKRFEEDRTLDAELRIDGRVVTPSVRTGQGARYVLPVRALGTAAHRVEVRANGPTFYALDGRWATPLGVSETVARGREVALHRVFETEAGAPIAPEGHVHLGDLVRVRLFVYSEGNTAPFVVIRDPVGGGFEAVDLGFATTPQSSLNALLGGGPDDGAIDPRGFYAARSIDQISHRAFHRGVTTFAFNTGASGLREYTYAVRATTVGTFSIAPAQLEAIYQPTQLARSAAVTLTVDP